LPAAHFDRNERYAYFGDRTLVHAASNSWLNPFAEAGAKQQLCTAPLLS